jgi:hypothetical protein
MTYICLQRSFTKMQVSIQLFDFEFPKPRDLGCYPLPDLLHEVWGDGTSHAPARAAIRAAVQ